MNGIARLAGPRTLASPSPSGCPCSPARSGVAAAPISYSTHGQIWPWQYGDAAEPGYQGENVISFIGVTDGTFDRRVVEYLPRAIPARPAAARGHHVL